MNRTVEAIFEGGVFKPLEPIELPERQAVRLSFELAASSEPAAPSVRDVLQSAGRLRELSDHLGQRILPGVALEEVRDALGRAAGKPLSEIVIEQRGPKG
jgi:predicted DNA-binding antitoxin AbrB/MazE fold protein